MKKVFLFVSLAAFLASCGPSGMFNDQHWMPSKHGKTLKKGHNHPDKK